MATLDDVVKAVKEANEGTATQQAKTTEAAAEKKVYDTQVLATLSSISEAIEGITPFKIKETDSKSFLGKILSSFGLIGAGALGLAGGLAVGWTTFVADLIKGVGKIVFKFVDAIPRPKFIDDIIGAFKAEGRIGKIFGDIKTFFIGSEKAPSIFKKVGNTLDLAIEGLKGFTGGIFTRINNFFGGDLSPFKRIAKVVDPVIDIVKGFTGGIFTRIGNVFTKIQDIGKSVGGSLKELGKVLGIGGDAAKVAKGAGKGVGIVKTLTDLFSPLSKVFGIMKSIGKVIAAPLTIIMGAFDAFFEAKDAIEKGGEDATLLEKITLGIVGALGGFIDGAIFQVADLIKDGLAYLAGFFGLDEVKKQLDSFSFSEVFNNMLDFAYGFIGRLFGDNPENEIAMKQKEIEEHKKQLKAGDERDYLLRSRKGQIEELEKEIAELEKEIPKAATGGLITKTGLAEIHKGELMLDNQAADVFMKAATLLAGSQALEQAGRGGAPVVVNNINNSQSNPVISNQATTLKVPDSVRSSDPTFALARQSFSY